MSRRLDARWTILAFVLLVSVWMAAPFFSWVWWFGCGLVGWGVWCAALTWRFVGRGLWRFRWLFLALLVIHGVMTPGEFLWSAWPVATREGVAAGVHQGVRLVVLALLAWSVGRVTTPLELVGAFYYYFSFLERCGLPVGRGLSILGFCLTGLGRFREQAEGVRMAMGLRLGVVSGWEGRLERLAFAGSALLSGLLRDLRRREEGLVVRGFADGLPSVRPVARPMRGADWLVPGLPGLLWIFWLFS
ncbi:MAG: hypothetical protein HQL91_05505 [Magnetococcales bacterium]|nr:hypothetical protein [Magnetococcales bacterium]